MQFFNSRSLPVKRECDFQFPFPGAKKLFQLNPEISNLDFPLYKSWNSDQTSYNSHQVWTLVQSCLILFSLTLGIVVAASRSNFTFLRCIGREEAFGWSDTLKKLYMSVFSGTTFQTSTNLTSFTGQNFLDLSGLRCDFSQTFPFSCFSLLCLLCMETFTYSGRNIQQQQ